MYEREQSNGNPTIFEPNLFLNKVERKIEVPYSFNQHSFCCLVNITSFPFPMCISIKPSLPIHSLHSKRLSKTSPYFQAIQNSHSSQNWTYFSSFKPNNSLFQILELSFSKHLLNDWYSNKIFSNLKPERLHQNGNLVKITGQWPGAILANTNCLTLGEYFFPFHIVQSTSQYLHDLLSSNSDSIRGGKACLSSSVADGRSEGLEDINLRNKEAWSENSVTQAAGSSPFCLRSERTICLSIAVPNGCQSSKNTIPKLYMSACEPKWLKKV